MKIFSGCENQSDKLRDVRSELPRVEHQDIDRIIYPLRRWRSLSLENRILSYFKSGGFDIDGDDLAIITFFNLRWRSLPEVIESEIDKSHHHGGQILLCYSGDVLSSSN